MGNPSTKETYGSSKSIRPKRRRRAPALLAPTGWPTGEREGGAVDYSAEGWEPLLVVAAEVGVETPVGVDAEVHSPTTISMV